MNSVTPQLTLDDRFAEEIDKGVIELYKNPKPMPFNLKYGLNSELGQLGRLFHYDFLELLQNKLENHVIRRSATTHHLLSTVDLAWIDKSPLAEFHERAVINRVELGDAFFIHRHVVIKGGVNAKKQETHYRALVVQAKKSRSYRLQAVPVTDSINSRKELLLLSQWPIIDIYRPGKRTIKSKLLTNVQIDKERYTASSYSCFAVCPPQARVFHTKSKKFEKAGCWKSQWMIGPSKEGEPCDRTLVLCSLIPCSGNQRQANVLL